MNLKTEMIMYLLAFRTKRKTEVILEIKNSRFSDYLNNKWFSLQESVESPFHWDYF